MNKLCILSLLLAAIALSSGLKIRRFQVPNVRRVSLSQLNNLNSLNTLQYPVGGQALNMFPAGNFINYPQPMAFNYPMQPGLSQFGHRRMPDGEYRTAHGIATVDGSDISMDAY